MTSSALEKSIKHWEQINSELPEHKDHQIGDTVTVNNERCIIVRKMVHLCDSLDLIYDVCRIKDIIPSIKPEAIK